MIRYNLKTSHLVVGLYKTGKITQTDVMQGANNDTR